ncbi:hypothetical protein MVEN_01974100 [Mycena venus]|uniref:Uncharacterized protein n=1 Tax=Mycena venus TaxID=2733690 RepID=A0A8H7CIJ2_9AGAR|nr:hypothetical protein MVEN_01974100 [Mycena venus]
MSTGPHCLDPSQVFISGSLHPRRRWSAHPRTHRVGILSRAPRYVNPGLVFAPGQKNVVRIIPAKPGYYFISTDLNSNPPSVMMDPNGPEPGGLGGRLPMVPMNEVDERQMWQFATPT